MTAQTTTATAPSTPSLAITTNTNHANPATTKTRQAWLSQHHTNHANPATKNTPSLAITTPHKPRQSGNKKHAKPGYHHTTLTYSDCFTPIGASITHHTCSFWSRPPHPHPTSPTHKTTTNSLLLTSKTHRTPPPLPNTTFWLFQPNLHITH